jgi:nucleoside-triphosphatase
MGIAHLLTGEPGIGKTTALKKIVEIVGQDCFGGFYTEEILAEGVRTGFRIVTLADTIGTIADVRSDSELRVGKYGVNLDSLEGVGVASIYEALKTKDYLIIDEIGPMQLFSEPFKRAVLDVIESPRLLFGTIVQRPYPWADELKQHSNVRLHTLTLDNRESLVGSLAALIEKENR